MQTDIYNSEYQKVGSTDIPDDIFAAPVNEALLWEQVKAQQASWRRGTHATKTRGEVSGGGIKPFKQKGTGRARQGSIRAPNHVGGGTVFGPQPRDYAYRLPRRARQAALRSALSLRARDGHLLIVDQFAINKPRTKTMLAFFAKIAEESVLIVDVDNHNLQLSIRNLAKSKFLDAQATNVYDILNHKKLIITQAALEEVINKAYGKNSVDVSAATVDA